MIREEFVKQVLSKERSKRVLCREYGISRPTGDKWIKRYLSECSLEDKSRVPFHTPNKTVSEMEQMAISYRRKYTFFGAVKIHKMLQNDGYTDLPCTITINEIFKRNGLITREASLAATPYKWVGGSEYDWDIEYCFGLYYTSYSSQSDYI